MKVPASGKSYRLGTEVDSTTHKSCVCITADANLTHCAITQN